MRLLRTKIDIVKAPLSEQDGGTLGQKEETKATTTTKSVPHSPISKGMEEVNFGSPNGQANGTGPRGVGASDGASYDPGDVSRLLMMDQAN